ncbi:VOC family protein [Pseudomonas sessilinigenes]|uniref:VOC domain-containing protein n=1 Tax=Pseudomonas sessilinigenes TaxID=658629 RepID=A0ABX8MVN1_9PSED|nr:VOC family protein [Pseudomonas sessilinigenes]AZC24314.1 hypothetical protein C4K39_2640 [Pseudomonas sessilinigenes]QXH43264.1 hypothetical protein KSS89_13915 [Pseudomonas sessilinigenes]
MSVAGFVLYSLDPQALARFYAALLGWPISDQQPDYLQLQHQGMELTLIQVPAAIAARIVLQDPPLPRSDSACKPVFWISDLDQARQRAASAGGRLYEPEREWRFKDARVCDGIDPEGNIFQLRQSLPQ